MKKKKKIKISLLEKKAEREEEKIKRLCQS